MAETRKPLFIGEVIAESPALRAVLATVERVAAARTPVVIHGETGVGKGLIAKILHRHSPRANQLFMPLNCSALTEQLLESELFGHERGAFTGAAGAKPGLFEVADGGTLFLDEFTEMSHGMQTKLLQVLDSGVMRRVGGTTLRSVDVRIVAASNKDLQAEVSAGRFRNDLFFRLNVISLRIPSLRRRREDIPGLVELYLDRFQEGLEAKRRKRISATGLEALCAHSWPGNVRELANTVERAVLLADGEVIGPRDLFPMPRVAGEATPAATADPPTLAEVERRHILGVLESTGGKKAPAARLLGINVKTLSRKLKSYQR
jgi:DNA-binding NtrC family response regulator